jgi:hypothetical protein
MTRDQLDAIRERLDGGYAPSSLDAALLLDEVESLQERERKLLEQNLAMMRVIAQRQETK